MEKTPLQQAISQMETELKTAKSFLKKGYKESIAKMKSFLPVEKQWAKEVHRNGELYGYAEAKGTIELQNRSDFPTYYSRFETSIENDKK